MMEILESMKPIEECPGCKKMSFYKVYTERNAFAIWDCADRCGYKEARDV